MSRWWFQIFLGINVRFQGGNHVFSAIYRGFPFHSIYNWVGAGYVCLKRLGFAKPFGGPIIVTNHPRYNLGNIIYQVIQFVTFLSPNVGGHQQPLEGSLFHHPKKVTIAELPGNCNIVTLR